MINALTESTKVARYASDKEHWTVWATADTDQMISWLEHVTNRKITTEERDKWYVHFYQINKFRYSRAAINTMEEISQSRRRY